MEVFASRAPEVCCGRGDVEVFASIALEVRRRRVNVDHEACCGPGDVEVFASRALEAHCWCSDEEVWRYGGGLQACRRGGVCLKGSGALEVRCRRVDMEVFASRAPEL